MNDLINHLARHNFDYAVMAFLVISAGVVVKTLFFMRD